MPEKPLTHSDTRWLHCNKLLSFLLQNRTEYYCLNILQDVAVYVLWDKHCFMKQREHFVQKKQNLTQQTLMRERASEINIL